MLDTERMKDVAETVSRSGAQKAAVMKALALVNDELAAGQIDDEVVAAPVTVPETVIAVCSGNVVPGDQASILWGALDRALERFGSIEVLTFGNQGAEAVAKRWAERNHQSAKEFAVCWAIPQPDGSTIRPKKPIGRRDELLLAYLEPVSTVVVLEFGSGDDRTQTWARNTARTLKTKAGAYHAGRKLPEVEPVADGPDVEDTPPVDELEASLQAEALAGQPDVPVEAAS